MQIKEILLEQNPCYSESRYRYHPRIWDRKGWVINLGCYGWDWCRPFIGTKKIIGVDPVPSDIPVWVDGIEPLFFQGFIGTINGRIEWKWKPDIHSISGHDLGENQDVIISLPELIKIFEIDSIDLLKMNIEGMEYEILINLRTPIADQIAVSFHEHMGYLPSATKAIIQYLDQWYDWIELDKQWKWYLFLRRDE